MKKGLIFILSLILILGYTVFGQNGVDAAFNPNAPKTGYYPQGTMQIDGVTGRTISVANNKSVPFTIKLSQAEKVCNVYVYLIKEDGGGQVKSRLDFPGPRSGGANTIPGTIDTTGLAAGKYQAFMYAKTNCGGDPRGSDNDGFDCDGNVTCWSYCKGENGSREQVDKAQIPFQPPDGPQSGVGAPELYDTNANTTVGAGAYYYSIKGKTGVNSCGSPKGFDPSNNDTLIPGRVGDCDLKACDPTGKNLDNFEIVVGSTTTPPTTGGTTTAPTTGGTTTTPNTPATAPVTGNTTFPATKAGGAVTVTTNTVSLTNTTTLDLAQGVVSVVSPANTINLNGASKSLTNYTGGSLTSKNISSVQVGGLNVVPGNGTTMVTSAPVVITNPGMSTVSVSIPANTTVFGGVVGGAQSSGAQWNGQIAPAVQMTPTETAGPSGFKLTSTLGFSLGSATNPLLFDNPVTITINGQAGPFGYREPGGTWLNVAQCTGTGNSYATPTAPAFGSECFMTDGTNSKIVTWHMTEFATLDLNSSVNFIASAGGICYDKTDPSNVAMSVEWGANFGYSCYQIARTECSSPTNCNGAEQLRTNQFFPAFVDPAMSFNDPTVTAGKYYKYRVWGYRTPTNATGPVDCQTLSQTLGNNPAAYDVKGWSLPVVVKASCEGQGSGINLQEYKVVPQS